MAEIFPDTSKNYHFLRKSNPVACGEWLLKLKKQGVSQTQIAERLGANRQMIGRYLRMAHWSNELKTLVFNNREDVSNTKLLRAASSPRSERELHEQIKRKAKVNEPSVDRRDEGKSVGKNEEERNHVGEKLSFQKPLTWTVLGRFVSQPTTIVLFLTISILGTYLVHQGVIFFMSIDTDNVSAISSAIISELIPLISAACFALSENKIRRGLSVLLLICSIIGLAGFMHSSLAQRQVDTSSRILALEKERKTVLRTMDTLNETAASLPNKFISRKQSIIEDIYKRQKGLEVINAGIADTTNHLSSSSNILLTYGVWLRIAAMILNAILAHVLFARLRNCCPA